MSLFLERKETPCVKCGAMFKYYWDGQYWCESCGTQASLIKLMGRFTAELQQLQQQIDRMYLSFDAFRKEIKGQRANRGGNEELLSRPN